MPPILFIRTLMNVIKTTTGKVEDMMKTTLFILEDLAINPDVTHYASEEMEYQSINIDTNDTEQMIADSTKALKIYNLFQDYGEVHSVYSSGCLTLLLDTVLLESALETHYIFMQSTVHILKGKFLLNL